MHSNPVNVGARSHTNWITLERSKKLRAALANWRAKIIKMWKIKLKCLRFYRWIYGLLCSLPNTDARRAEAVRNGRKLQFVLIIISSFNWWQNDYCLWCRWRPQKLATYMRLVHPHNAHNQLIFYMSIMDVPVNAPTDLIAMGDVAMSGNGDGGNTKRNKEMTLTTL